MGRTEEGRVVKEGYGRQWRTGYREKVCDREVGNTIQDRRGVETWENTSSRKPETVRVRHHWSPGVSGPGRETTKRTLLEGPRTLKR